MLPLNLNYLPIEVRIRRRNGLLSSVVPTYGDSFTDEDLEILSIKLEKMGVDHFINSCNEISISNDIDITATDVSTKNFKERREVALRSLVKYSPEINEFVDANFNKCTKFVKRRVAMMLNGDMSSHLHWGGSSFLDAINSQKIDITKLRDMHALQNAIYEAFLASKDNVRECESC